MYGKATFAMLVSKTSMNAASETTLPINHGLYFGRHVGSLAGERVACSSLVSFALIPADLFVILAISATRLFIIEL